jgi:uncharacterized membrane protein YdbT with pleckstrin-like domain
VDLLPGEQLIWKGKPTWRATMSFYLLWGLLALVPLAVILVVRATTDATWPIWLAIVITVGLLAIVLLVGWIRRFFTQYTVTTKRMSIREGILSKREQTAHVDRIQNITINQSPFDRIFKVGVVVFDTAGETGSAQLTFWGVDRPQDLRDRIARANEAATAAETQGGIAG